MYEFDQPMHDWFSLTYANYLVLPRSLIQEMPVEWQKRFVALLEEMETEFPKHNDAYMVKVRGERGRFICDLLAEYRRPDKNAINEMRK